MDTKMDTKNPIFQSKRKYLMSFGIIFVIMLSLGFAGLVYFVNNLPYSRIWGILLGGIGLVVGLYFVYELLKIPKIIFYEADFQVIDFFGFRRRTFKKNDVEKWTCQKKSNKGNDYHQLSLWLKSGEKIKLYSYNYKNYTEIFNQFSNIKRQDKLTEKALEERQNRIAGSISLLLSVFLFYQFYDSLPISLTEKDTFELVGNLSKPVLERTTGNNRRFLGYDLFLKEYPYYRFEVRKSFSTEELKYFLENNKDLKISILQTEYQAKILRSEKASVLKKYISPYTIDVVGISPYFSFSDYEKRVNESYNRYVFLIFGIIALGVAIFFLKFSNNFNRFNNN